MDYEKKDYFEFSALAGGYFGFSGVMDNDKQIQKIDVDREQGVAKITYADGFVFTVTANIQALDEDNQKFLITNITKEWSKISEDTEEDD